MAAAVGGAPPSMPSSPADLLGGRGTAAPTKEGRFTVCVGKGGGERWGDGRGGGGCDGWGWGVGVRGGGVDRGRGVVSGRWALHVRPGGPKSCIGPKLDQQLLLETGDMLLVT